MFPAALLPGRAHASCPSEAEKLTRGGSGPANYRLRYRRQTEPTRVVLNAGCSRDCQRPGTQLCTSPSELQRNGAQPHATHRPSGTAARGRSQRKCKCKCKCTPKSRPESSMGSPAPATAVRAAQADLNRSAHPEVRGGVLPGPLRALAEKRCGSADAASVSVSSIPGARRDSVTGGCRAPCTCNKVCATLHPASESALEQLLLCPRGPRRSSPTKCAPVGLPLPLCGSPLEAPPPTYGPGLRRRAEPAP